MKKHRWCGNIRKSIFAKLILIMAATGLVMHFVVGAVFWRMFAHENRTGFRKNLQVYANYLINDIGVPPDLKKAEYIAQKTSLSISITSAASSWSTGKIDIDKRFYHMKNIDAYTQIGWHRGRFVYIKQKGNYTFTFIPGNDFTVRGGEKHLAALIVIISVLLLIAYLVLKRMLRPIALLSAGVKEITEGNLDFQVPVIKNDELGELTKSFNAMNSQIKNMLKAKEQLLLDVSHELRSPLTRMKVSIEFLDNPDIKQSLQDDISELEIMITEILETERMTHLPGELNLEMCNISELVKQVVTGMPVAPQRINVHASLRDIVLSVDREKIKRLFRNLLENGIKYSSETGPPVEVFARVEQAKEIVEIEVRDHGEGIPEEELAFIFEPFYRVDRSRSRQTGGYGLGMSLCKKIMEAHNGSIEIESEMQKGTVIILRFYPEE